MLQKGFTIGGLTIDKDLIVKFLRFCVAGAISYGIQLGLTQSFVLMTIDLMISYILSIIIAHIIHFFLNKDFAFRYKHKTRLVQFLYFTGMGAPALMIQLVVTDIGTKLFNLWWPIAILAGILVSTLFNFVTNNWLIFIEPKTKEESRLKEQQINITIYVLLFLFSLFIGLLIVTNTPAIINSDNLHLELNGEIIIARHGLPYFRWTHTPLYRYLIAIVLVVFGDTTFFFRLVQVVIYALTVVFVFGTVRLKKSRGIAILAAIFYMASYFPLFAASDIHEEGLWVLFAVLSFYFAFLYEKEKKTLWLWLYALFLGMAFFTKETGLIVLGVYAIYMIFWVKPPRKDLIFAGAIFGVFVGAFLIVEFLQDWYVFVVYLGLDAEGAGSFLSGAGINFSKLFMAILVDPVSFGLAILNIIVLLVKFIKSKKLGSDEFIALSVLVFFGFFIISRAYLYHLIYVTFLVAYLASDSLFFIIDWFSKSAPKYASLYRKNPKKAMVYLLLPIIGLHAALFIPNIVSVRNRGLGLVAVYQEIGTYVQNDKTYCEIATGINYYIPNLYSYNGFYNSYERNGWMFWNESDIFRITDMDNITSRGLKYFLYEEAWVQKDSYFYNITRNGTLTSVKNFTYINFGMYETMWWAPSVESTIELYQI